MKTALLIAGALAPLALAAPALSATCITTGLSVNCAGSVTGGFSSGTAGLSVRVAAGAGLTNDTGDAVRVRGANVTVANYGTISGTRPAEQGGSDGVDGGDGLAVLNSGTITATGKAIDADKRNGIYIQNHGTITAQDKAIRNADGTGSTLLNAGLIDSIADEGFESGDRALVMNYGTIRGSDDAVQVGENAVIQNYGLIESVRRGGDAADPQDGIDIDSGTIYNAAGAVIRSDDDAAIDYDGSVIASEIHNHGTISGAIGVLTDPANLARQLIVNHGLIEGRDGTSLDLGAGSDEVRLSAGSRLLGDALFGTGDDILVLGASIYGDVTDGVMDGGAGNDTILFTGLAFADIFSVALDDRVMTLSFDGREGRYALQLTSWERFTFSDASYDWADVAALSPSAVPLPGGAALSLGALAALAGLRRRGRKT